MVQPGWGPSRLTSGLLTSWCTKQNEANEEPLKQGWTQRLDFCFDFFFLIVRPVKVEVVYLWKEEVSWRAKEFRCLWLWNQTRKDKGLINNSSDPWATWVLTAWVHCNWDFFHWLVLQYCRIRGGLNSWILRNCIYEGLTRSYTWIFNCIEGHCP